MAEQLRLWSEEALEVQRIESMTRSIEMTTECIERDEPFFVLRAKDIFSVMAVRQYGQLVENYGPLDDEFQEKLVLHADLMRDWQQNNPSLVKYPD